MGRKIRLESTLLWVDRLGRGLVSLIFVFAAVPKLVDIWGFASTIAAYAILPEVLVLPTAFVLPVIEIILAIGLALNRFESKAGITVLLIIFIVILSYAIWQGLDIDCGCFGPEDPEYNAFKGLRVALVRDVLLLMPLIYSFWYHGYQKRLFT